MPTVEITTHVSPDELLHGVEQLDASELDRFVERVLAMQAQRRSTSLSAEETQLLQQINLSISANTWQRYNELKAKRRDEKLSPAEHRELIATSNDIEKANVRRIQALAKLAVLRQTSLDVLMDKLGIIAPAYE
jgi:hypothetical protein